jgi:hypothetical protein
LQEALIFASKAKKILPDDPNIMDTIGWIYYQQGLLDFALRELVGASEKLKRQSYGAISSRYDILQEGAYGKCPKNVGESAQSELGF